jgi:hypothetical protein
MAPSSKAKSVGNVVRVVVQPDAAHVFFSSIRSILARQPGRNGHCSNIYKLYNTIIDKPGGGISIPYRIGHKRQRGVTEWLLSANRVAASMLLTSSS